MSQKCGFIALAGRPNAGKSTFLNRVLGEKVSIVSDKPQTTRNRITGVFHGDQCQIGFLDLPGIHKPKHKMNRMMMRSVNLGLEDADLIFHFIDVSAPIGTGDRFVKEFLAGREVPVILVLNKLDLINKSKVIPVLERVQDIFQPAEMIPISSKTGENIDRLLALAQTLLPEAEQLFGEDVLTDQPLRFMAQELIREKLLHFTNDELPHATAVSLESFQDQDSEVLIGAVIWVERATQRRIVLGAGGAMIRKIRLAARRSLKLLLGKPVSVELYVKVREKWRETEKLLAELRIPES